MMKRLFPFLFLSIIFSYAAKKEDPTGFDPEEVFTRIYDHRSWSSEETVSGQGSLLKNTVSLRILLPQLVKELEVHSLLDAACGDFNWMKEVVLPDCKYIGVDIVQDMIKQNKMLYEDETHFFHHANIISDFLPQSDLIICKDVLVHLSLQQAMRAIKNMKKSAANYLLATTFPDPSIKKNSEIFTGNWRPLDLQKPPFNFPEPILLIRQEYEDQKGKSKHKCLGLWLFSQLDL